MPKLIVGLYVLLIQSMWVRAADDKILISHVRDAQSQNGLIVIDMPEGHLRTAVYNRLQELFPGEVYAVKGASAPLVLPDKTPFMSKDKAGRDLCTGGALCAGGIGLVVVAGKERSSPPSGLAAQVGDKYMTGGGACIVGAMWVSGAFFIVKGFFEIMMSDKSSETSSLNGQGNPYAKQDVHARREVSLPNVSLHDQELLVIQEVLKYRQLPSSKIYNLLAR